MFLCVLAIAVTEWMGERVGKHVRNDIFAVCSVQCALCIMAWMYNLVPRSPFQHRSSAADPSAVAAPFDRCSIPCCRCHFTAKYTFSVRTAKRVVKSYCHCAFIKAMPETNLVKTHTCTQRSVFLTPLFHLPLHYVKLLSTAHFPNKHKPYSSAGTSFFFFM